MKALCRTSLIAALLTVGMLASPLPARAVGTIIVNTADDEATANGTCSLREAMTNIINGANTYTECGWSGETEITFAGNYTITLGSQLPVVDTTMTITGNGAANTIIQANAAADTAIDRLFYVDLGGYVTISGVTLRHGRCNGSCSTFGNVGGAIYVYRATLIVNDSVLTGNVASSDGVPARGGAIYADWATIHVNNSTLLNNSAQEGGALYVPNNGSPAIYVSRSLFDSNEATGTLGNQAYGGAIAECGAQMYISNSTFASNSTSTSVSVAGGGAINISCASFASELRNVTFYGNTSRLGGALYNSSASTPTLTNVILWGDTATDSGNEIYNGDTSSPTINHSVVQGGDGGIVSVAAITPFSSGSGNTSDDPLLGALADNGGPTQTIALLGGSSAFGAGDNTICSDPSTVNSVDQRGVRRPQGLHCDVGAFEVSQTPTDFEGDGVTNPAKYVPAAGAVYYYQSSGSAYLGTDGDYILNSDLDGDGKTDPAKYVASAGAIWYLASADNAWHGVYIGSDGDFIPGSDFDGDGIADPAKYVAAAGAVWYYGTADSTWHGIYIGDLGAGVYVPGSDFDGDGKTDPAHTDSAGNIWYLGSLDSTVHGHFIGSDGPYVPRSDYDGDGVTDPAKFASGSIWYLQSSNSYALTSLALGAGPDFVVPGSDFDGDGITDPAWFASDAMWWTRSTDAGAGSQYMGGDTYDIVN